MLDDGALVHSVQCVHARSAVTDSADGSVSCDPKFNRKHGEETQGMCALVLSGAAICDTQHSPILL